MLDHATSFRIRRSWALRWAFSLSVTKIVQWYLLERGRPAPLRAPPRRLRGGWFCFDFSISLQFILNSKKGKQNFTAAAGLNSDALVKDNAGELVLEQLELVQGDLNSV